MLNEVSSTFGIPDVVLSDNGPQFRAESFAQFAKKCGFIHVMNSQTYLETNGEAERAVRIMKVMKKTGD